MAFAHVFQYILQNSSLEISCSGCQLLTKVLITSLQLDDLMADSAFISGCMQKVLGGGSITFEEAERLLATNDVTALADSANTITRTFNGDTVDVEALINAKSGKCPEDCSFCAQSSFYDTGITKYPLLPKKILVEN